MRATDEALPELLIQRILSEEKRDMLARLQQDDRLRVFLRQDGARSRKAVYLTVPEHWFLAGLWRAFDAVGEKPYRPVNKASHCRVFLLVRLRTFGPDELELSEPLFLEPHTGTLWLPRENAWVRIRERRGSSLPRPTALGPEGLSLPSGGVVRKLEPDSWCIAEIR